MLYVISFNIMQDDGDALLFLQPEQGIPQVDIIRCLLLPFGEFFYRELPFSMPLDIVAHVQENTNDPGLQIALILQTVSLFPAAADGLLYGILLVCFDQQLAAGDPVERGRHPDNGLGKGLVGHFGSS